MNDQYLNVRSKNLNISGLYEKTNVNNNMMWVKKNDNKMYVIKYIHNTSVHNLSHSWVILECENEYIVKSYSLTKYCKHPYDNNMIWDRNDITITLSHYLH